MNTNVPTGAALVVDYDVAMEVASHEAIIRQAYKDSQGIWTWSVGLTSATGHVVERYVGNPQSLEHCLRVYVWALDNYADAVRKAFAGVELSKEQFAAALSFQWNTGQIGKASWVKLFKAGKLAEAKKAFMNYSKPKAIVPRRQAERDLFFSGKWSNTGKMVEYTRVTAKGTPDWGSAKRINVEKELKAALGSSISLDASPAPASPEPAPSPSMTDTVTVEVVQRKLYDLGYTEVGSRKPDGSFDGKLGGMTQAAILIFRADNGLPSVGTIDQDLLTALDTAPKRKLARNDATAGEVRQSVPEVRSNWRIKIGAIVAGGFSAAGALFDGIVSQLGTARGYLSDMSEYVGDVPGWVKFGILVALAGGAYYIAQRGERKGVEAFQEGARR